jgi:FGGY family of carbohydrate kinases, N-terminal domain
VLLMGVDCGSTAIKAVIFDETGISLATASRRVAAICPAPGHVEQDMAQLWLSAAAAMREAVALCGRSPGQIGCIGVTAHGDGLNLADRSGAPHPTDASTAFTNPHTQAYDPDTLKLFDLQEIEGRRPSIFRRSRGDACADPTDLRTNRRRDKPGGRARRGRCGHAGFRGASRCDGQRRRVGQSWVLRPVGDSGNLQHQRSPVIDPCRGSQMGGARGPEAGTVDEHGDLPRVLGRRRSALASRSGPSSTRI